MSYSLNELDLALLHSLRVGPEPGLLQSSLEGITRSPLCKGEFVVTLFWLLWFGDRNPRRTRADLLSVVIIAVIAIVVGRVTQTFLPFRFRPLADSAIPDNPFAGVPHHLESWSSMPSDHAVLYFAFATGLLLVHAEVGLVALLHAVLIISLPRIALWYHYPTDILAGAVMGCALVLLLFEPVSNRIERQDWIRVFDTRPGLAYACFFLVSFQIATMFDSLRHALSFLRDLAAAAIS
ncbi:MAG: phosphatase PAP2 family protein [Hyphomicrobiales bacterium]